MARLAKWEQAVRFLVDRNRLESFEAEDLAALTETLVARACCGLRLLPPRRWRVVTSTVHMSLLTTLTGWLQKHSWLGKHCAQRGRRVAYGG